MPPEDKTPDSSTTLTRRERIQFRRALQTALVATTPHSHGGEEIYAQMVEADRAWDKKNHKDDGYKGIRQYEGKLLRQLETVQLKEQITKIDANEKASESQWLQTHDLTESGATLSAMQTNAETLKQKARKEADHILALADKVALYGRAPDHQTQQTGDPDKQILELKLDVVNVDKAQLQPDLQGKKPLKPGKSSPNQA